MRGMLNHFRNKGLVLGLVMGAGVWVLASAACAQAAENAVRLPVEKSVRLAPPVEASAAKPAKPAETAEPTPAPAKAEAPKPEARKPEAPKADPAKTPVPVAEPKPAPAPKAAAKAKPKADAPQPADTDAAKAPEAKPAPKPKPEPTVDPLALEVPVQPAREAVALPGDGKLVGEVELEFLQDRIVLRATANGPVERVTHFGLTAPRKLALDMRGGWRKKGGTVLRFDTGPVKAVVTGHHPDRLRLAVEFREGAVAPDMQPVVELGPRGFTATIPLAVRLKR